MKSPNRSRLEKGGGHKEAKDFGVGRVPWQVKNEGGKQNTPCRERLGKESLFRRYWECVREKRKREKKEIE